MSETLLTTNQPDEIESTEYDLIPIQDLIYYRERGLSYSEIAKLANCSKQNVHERLQNIKYSPSSNDNFRKHRGDVLSFIQSRLLNTLDDSALQEMSPYQRIIAMGILFDKERLERGESSSNVSISLSTRLQKALKRRQSKVVDVQPTTTSPDALQSSPDALPAIQPVVSSDTQVK